MKRIIPFLWFDSQAEEAVKLYTSLIPDSQTGVVSSYDPDSAEISNQPEGGVMSVSFSLQGQEFAAMNGGPVFRFTPAISFFVNCNSAEEVDAIWSRLSEGGSAMMPLDKYPFSEKYGWIQDQYGLSWQLNLTDQTEPVRPCLMFVGDQHGKSEEAIRFYTSLFRDSEIGMLARYEEGEGGEVGTIKHGTFTLNGQGFIAMDSNFDHRFGFTEAVSFLIDCENQEEVDRFWNALADGGEEQQCGWLKDSYGVSWQVVPDVLNRLLSDPDPLKSQQVMQAMLQMKKLDIKTLMEAYES